MLKGSRIFLTKTWHFWHYYKTVFYVKSEKLLTLNYFFTKSRHFYRLYCRVLYFPIYLIYNRRCEFNIMNILNLIVHFHRVWQESSVVKCEITERIIIGSRTTKENFFENEQKISFRIKHCFRSIFRWIWDTFDTLFIFLTKSWNFWH